MKFLEIGGYHINVNTVTELRAVPKQKGVLVDQTDILFNFAMNGEQYKIRIGSTLENTLRIFNEFKQ